MSQTVRCDQLSLPFTGRSAMRLPRLPTNHMTTAS